MLGSHPIKLWRAIFPFPKALKFVRDPYKKDKINDTVDYDGWPIFGIIITNKLCTLHELQTIYSYEDALYLLDIVLTNNYNTRIMEENNNPDK